MAPKTSSQLSFCLKLFLLSYLTGLICYFPGLNYSGYVMDDSVAVKRNPLVFGHTVTFRDYMRRDFWGLDLYAGTWTHKSFRPVTTYTYRLNYLIGGLIETSIYHQTNIFLHCFCSSLIGLVARHWLGFGNFWCFLSSAIFAAHPIHTENVLYLVGRADILGAIFALFAVLFYSLIFYKKQLNFSTEEEDLNVTQTSTPHRVSNEEEDDTETEEESIQSASYSNVDFCKTDYVYTPNSTVFAQLYRNLFGLALMTLFIVLSGLSKEVGFTYLALIAGSEFLSSAMRAALQPSKRDTKYGVVQRLFLKNPLQCGSAFRFWSTCFITLLILYLRYRHTGGTDINMSVQDNPIQFEISAMTRKLSYGFIHAQYFRLLVFPSFLCYDYSMNAIPLLEDLEDVRNLFTLTAYLSTAALLCFGLLKVRKGYLNKNSDQLNFGRRLLISFFAIVIPWFPASNILFPVGTVIGERLLYLPSIGYIFMLITFANNFCMPNRLAASGEIAKNGNKFGFNFLVGIFFLMLVRCFLRTLDWKDADTLFLTDGVIQPNSAKTTFNVGITHMMLKNWDLATKALLECAYLDPLSALPFYRLGQIEILRGRFQSAEMYLILATTKFGATLMIRDEELFHDVALALYQNKRYETSKVYLEIALTLNPYFPKALSNMGCCVAGIDGDLNRAIELTVSAVTLDPDNILYWNNLAVYAKFLNKEAVFNEAYREITRITNLRGLGQVSIPNDCTWEFAPAE